MSNELAEMNALPPSTRVGASADRAPCQGADRSSKRRNRLVVFADDWGRHPSSCQHLVRQLLTDCQVYWVNTIGMRSPRINRSTFLRGAEKITSWVTKRSRLEPAESPAHVQPIVLNPLMWPGFRRQGERGLNRRLLQRYIRRSIPRSEECVFLTTIPVVADLVGTAPSARWVYYRVDDFALWPGHDAESLAAMEHILIDKVDRIVVAGDNLLDTVRRAGRQAQVITHGVDLDFWRIPADGAVQGHELTQLPRPVVLFWGLIDRRLDVDWLTALSRTLPQGAIVLAGPEQDAPPELSALPRVHRIGAQPLHRLPHLAAQADVLIMPYADCEMTRSLQPLKLKEYLAAGKPVVVRNLPAVETWRDCLDAASTSAEFVRVVLERCTDGLPAAQRSARTRLADESWSAKASQLRQVLFSAEENPS